MKRRKCLALLLASAMVLTSMGNTGTAQAAKKVKLSKSKVSLQVGKTATIRLKNATKKDKKKVKWSISNNKVATVTVTKKVNAKIKAKKKGTADLVAKIGKKEYTCKITVTAKKSAATAKPVGSASAGAVTATSATTVELSKDPLLFTAAPTPEVPKKPVVVATQTPTETPVVLNTPFDAPDMQETKVPAQTARPAFVPSPGTVVSGGDAGGNVPTETSPVYTQTPVYTQAPVYTQTPVYTLTPVYTPEPTPSAPAMVSSNQLLLGATSTDSSVQGISIYMDGTYNYIEVFGTFDDIQTVMASIQLDTADNVDTSISDYTVESDNSDQTAGYYTVTVSGYVNSTYTTEKYILAKFGEFSYTTSYTDSKDEQNSSEPATTAYASITGFSEIVGRNTIVAIPGELNDCVVTSIGNYAFQDKNIQNIILPDSVTGIGNSAFYGCNYLRNIVLPDELTSIGGNAFRSCYLLESIELPATLTSIDYDAFWNCDSLTSVILPDSLTYIGNWLFESCDSLRYVELPEGIESISYGMFYRCSSLDGIEIPESVTSIGSYAFYYCNALENVEFPASVQSISSYAFAYCTALDYVYLPATITSVGDYAFGNCPALSYESDASGVSELAFATESSEDE